MSKIKIAHLPTGTGSDEVAVGNHQHELAPLTAQSSDPADPSDGEGVIWLSDGTGTGDEGDVLIKITVGEVTKTVVLVDFSEA